jgi:hypothetical protein
MDHSAGPVHDGQAAVQGDRLTGVGPARLHSSAELPTRGGGGIGEPFGSGDALHEDEEAAMRRRHGG